MRAKIMSEATVRLLQAAADLTGGEEALARHLNIGELLMRAYLEGRRPLPDFLLLRAVAVVLDHVRQPAPNQAAVQALDETVRELGRRST
jgi:hypothetical protein